MQDYQLNVDPHDESDQKLYQQLDPFSKKFRDCAIDMADFLSPVDSKTKEILDLIHALQAIKSIAISEIDIGINNVKNQLLRLSLHIEENKSFVEAMGTEKIAIFIKKEEALIKEAHLLVEKAIALTEKH